MTNSKTRTAPRLAPEGRRRTLGAGGAVLFYAKCSTRMGLVNSPSRLTTRARLPRIGILASDGGALCSKLTPHNRPTDY